MLNDDSSADPVFKDIYLRDEAPPHPGEVLREDIFPKLGLTRTALAKCLGISVKRLSNLLAERTPMTVELALRLAKVLGLGPRYWLGLQMQHDLWLTEQPTAFDLTPLDWKRPPRSACQTNLRPLGYR